MARYSIVTTYTSDPERITVGTYRILDHGTKGYGDIDDPVVWSRPITLEDEELGFWPADLRAVYEKLCGRGEFSDAPDPQPGLPNVVELMVDEDDCAWDQPCLYGHRVEQHAVYCHNEGWLYAPGKCRRNRTDWRHEDCRGFKPNPRWAGE